MVEAIVDEFDPGVVELTEHYFDKGGSGLFRDIDELIRRLGQAEELEQWLESNSPLKIRCIKGCTGGRPTCRACRAKQAAHNLASQLVELLEERQRAADTAAFLLQPERPEPDGEEKYRVPLFVPAEALLKEADSENAEWHAALERRRQWRAEVKAHQGRRHRGRSMVRPPGDAGG